MSLRIVRVADLPGFHNPFKCDQRRFLTAEGRRLELERARRLAKARGPGVAQARRYPWELHRPPPRRVDAAARASAERVDVFVGQVREAHDHELHSLPTSLLGIDALMTEAEAIAIIANARGSLADSAGPPDCRYHVDEGRPIDWKAIAEVACDVAEQSGATTSEDALEDATARLGNDTERHLLCSLFSYPIIWHPGSPRLGNGQHRVCGLVLGGADRVPVED